MKLLDFFKSLVPRRHHRIMGVVMHTTCPDCKQYVWMDVSTNEEGDEVLTHKECPTKKTT